MHQPTSGHEIRVTLTPPFDLSTAPPSLRARHTGPSTSGGCSPCRTSSPDQTGRGAVAAPPFYLTRYEPSSAAVICTWVRSSIELTYLAPGTAPPLTAEKVAAWGRDRANRLLLCTPDGSQPIGYGELNPMAHRADQMWIGHLIVNPDVRGAGIGRRFTQALLARAFLQYGAAEVLLLVFPDNRPALACYEGCGMVVTGREHKSFEATRQRHLFLRMSIKAARFHRWVERGRMPPAPLPFHA